MGNCAPSIELISDDFMGSHNKIKKSESNADTSLPVVTVATVVTEYCPIKGCQKQKLSKYCSDHQCNEDKCANLTLAHPFCIYHECELENCHNEKYSHTDNCKIHCCGFNSGNIVFSGSRTYITHSWHSWHNCHNPIIDINSNTCKIHKCIVEHCNNSRRAQNTKYCTDHMCLFCEVPIEFGSKYCSTHKCKDVECTRPCVPNHNYCLVHKCKICNHRIQKNKLFCKLHCCNVDNCKASSLVGDGVGDGFCKHHKCIVDDCCVQKKKDVFVQNIPAK